MNKTLLSIAAGAALALFAVSASASTLTVEGVNSSTQSGAPDFRQLRVDAEENFGALTVGTEVNGQQLQSTGSTSVDAAIKLGTSVTSAPFVKLPTGLSLYGDVQGGESFAKNSNTNFYGLEAGVRYHVCKPVTIDLSYRVRDGFESPKFVEQRRAHLGLNYAVSSNYSVGVGYYREFDRVDSNGLAVSLTRKF